MVFYVLERDGNKIVDPPTYNLLNNNHGGNTKRHTYRSIADMVKGTCMVRIYSNGCVHCHNMKDNYMGLNAGLLKDINILDIEVGSDDYQRHGAQWVSETRNKGVPHMFIMKNEKIIDEYSGDRTTKDMLGFIEKHVKHQRTKMPRSSKLKYLPSSVYIHKKTMKRKKSKRGRKRKTGKKRKRTRR